MVYLVLYNRIKERKNLIGRDGQMEIVFKIAGLGLALSLIESVMSAAGKEQWAKWIAIIGFITCLYFTIDYFEGILGKILHTFNGFGGF
jgi:stage III sporulation protein AC